MGSFLANVHEIFEVAQQSGEPEDMTIHLNSSSFRIRRAQGRVTVEGQSGAQRCLLQTVQTRLLTMPDQPRYVLA